MDSRRLLATLGLVAFVLLDVSLVAWALWPSTAPAVSLPAWTPSSAVTTSSPAAPTSSAASLFPTPSATPSPSATRSPADEPATRQIAGVSADVVWAADQGTCEAPGTVHVSTDGGASWATRAAPGAVTRLRPSGPDSAFVVGGDAACDIRMWDTGDGGRSWSDPQSAAAAWGRDAVDPTLVHRPGAGPVTPCRSGALVLDLAGLRDGVASVVCGGGVLRSTADGGKTWTTTLSRPGLAAVSLAAPGRGVVAGIAPGCDGVTVIRFRDGKGGAATCAGTTRPRHGQVSVSVADGATWLVAGTSVLRAPGGGDFEAVGTWPAG